MLVSTGLITYLTASVGFTALVILHMIFRRDTPLGRSLLLACAATATWAALVATGSTSLSLPVTVTYLSELARNGCWLFVLLQLLAIESGNSPWAIGNLSWRKIYFPTILTAAMLLLVRPLLPPALISQTGLYYQFVIVLWLALALLGLVLIEQLYRNASQSARWSIKYLCLGLGALLAYDFFMYAEALLFRELDTDLWEARGLVNAFSTPLLAVAISRNSNWQVNLQVSRQVAFHTVTLTGAGLYLLGMAAAGYTIRYLGGSWGSLLQVGFMVAAAALLLILLFSGRLRSEIRVFLSKHFYRYRYDYREEWLKFTHALANLDDNVAEGIIRIMAPLTSSPAGLLWGSDDGQTMHMLANWDMPPHHGAGLGSLPTWFQKSDWVIDLEEWRNAPDLYEDLELPDWLRNDTQLWLIVPLMFRDQLQAILILRKSPLKHRLDWEDRDLLKTAGRQAATHLAQHLASRALVEARQFEAFNRLSAYVVHDLKNILAQQSLIVSNAIKHRDNPAFIDDMISTVENSVKRMQRLMDQMRSGIRNAPAEKVQLVELLQAVIGNRQDLQPKPRMDTAANECFVAADRERLITVFNHLVQNAQEATDAQGDVIVSLTLGVDTVKIEIKDTGKGMTEDFIRDRLFRPFESTKGLTGMGIGAFESREYIRQLGGEISVTSEPGHGTTFHVTIPTVTSGRDRHDQEPDRT